MTCISFHQWLGCVCTQCGETRHEWDSNWCRCRKCYKDQDHVWDGCKCSKCNVNRGSNHDLDGCTCKKCGQTIHTWNNFICENCGKNSLIEKLFEGEHPDSWDAMHDLEKQGVKENEIEEICRLLFEGQGSRPPIDLLKRIGNPDCLSALLHVINERYDFGELDCAKDAIESIIRRNPNSISNDELKKIMTLPDKEGSVYVQSDYSWDSGHSQNNIVNLDGLRKLARTTLNTKYS